MGKSESGTRLAEVKLSNVSKAAAAFQPKGNVTPLVLVPTARSPTSWVMFVPSDCYVLMQNCGQHVPEGQSHYQGAGIKFLPPWWRIAYLVTRQAVTYNAPVASVPTKDNVPVEVDITLVFTISNPYKFVYELGVLRFDEYLKAAADESIRMLVREVPHHEIRDFKGEFGSTMLQNMNSKFNQLGVDFTTVLVTDVKLPVELARLLENITTVKAQRAVQERDFTFELQKMDDDSKKKVQLLEQANEAEQLKIGAQKKHALIDKERLQARCTENRTKSMRAAEEAAKVADIKSKAALEKTVLRAEKDAALAIAEAEQYALAVVRKAEQGAAQTRVQAQQKAREMELKAKVFVSKVEASTVTEARAVESEARATFSEVEAEAQGTVQRAEAEGRAQEAFEELRSHELRRRQLDLQAGIVGSCKVVLKDGGADGVLDAVAGLLAGGMQATSQPAQAWAVK